MLIEILNKVFTVIFFMACLTTFRHGYYFIQAYILSKSVEFEEPVKYKLTNTSLLYLGVSIAYILTVIFTGIKIN
jgi:hypothetical protein